MRQRLLIQLIIKRYLEVNIQFSIADMCQNELFQVLNRNEKKIRETI